jgi:hypothetical protein
MRGISLSRRSKSGCSVYVSGGSSSSSGSSRSTNSSSNSSSSRTVALKVVLLDVPEM